MSCDSMISLTANPNNAKDFRDAAVLGIDRVTMTTRRNSGFCPWRCLMGRTQGIALASLGSNIVDPKDCSL